MARRKVAASRVPSRRPPEGLSARFRGASVATYGPVIIAGCPPWTELIGATPGLRDGTARAVSVSEQTRSERHSSRRHAPTRVDMKPQVSNLEPS